MTKRLFFIQSMLFSLLLTAGLGASYVDPRAEALCFFQDYDETARGFKFCQSMGIIDRISMPASIDCYDSGIIVMSMAIYAELIEHMVNCIKNYTPERGLSFALRSNKCKRIIGQMVVICISHYFFSDVERLLYLVQKGKLWRFVLSRILQYGSSYMMSKFAYRAIKEFLHQRFIYLYPQESLLGEECLVCWEDDTDNELIVPCGDERHPICVKCYPEVVRDMQYRCPVCRRIVPEQNVSLRPLSVCDKIERLTATEKFRVFVLLLGECIILYAILLLVSEDFFASSGRS